MKRTSMIDKSTPGLWVYPNGREVIRHTAAGRKILQQRWNTAWRESRGICCLCDYPVHPFQASLEHKHSKGLGGSTHDDRKGNLGISHRSGNVAKGGLSLEKYRELPLAVRLRNCEAQLASHKVEVDRLVQALQDAKRNHYECEDTW